MLLGSLMCGYLLIMELKYNSELISNDTDFGYRPPYDHKPALPTAYNNIMEIIVLGVMFFLSGIGNLTLFVTLFQRRSYLSRTEYFIIHLIVSHLIVTFVYMPIEVIWYLSVSWRFGDLGCRAYKLLSTTGFYMTSYATVVLSLDQCITVLFPFRIYVDGNCKVMAGIAWLIAVITSLPLVSGMQTLTNLYISWLAWSKRCLWMDFQQWPAWPVTWLRTYKCVCQSITGMNMSQLWRSHIYALQ